MKMKDLKDKSISELKLLKGDFLQERFNLYMQRGSKQESIRFHLLKNARKNIARIETILQMRKLNENC